MKDVKRYDIENEGMCDMCDIDENENGVYVKYSDYKNLQSQIERLKKSKWISVKDDSPQIGQKVLLSIHGVVQEEIYTYDMTDTNDYGGISHFWSRDDLDECPELEEDDLWQPLPSKGTI